MIRWCVQKLRMDARDAEQRKEKKQAVLYLEYLATRLEDQSAAVLSDNLTTPAPSTEGEPPCISA
jgi:hypothetical protein